MYNSLLTIFFSLNLELHSALGNIQFLKSDVLDDFGDIELFQEYTKGKFVQLRNVYIIQEY